MVVLTVSPWQTGRQLRVFGTVQQRPCTSCRRVGARKVISMAAHHQELVDVAIVGGGLGGLTTAVAIRRALPNASVKVYEQFPGYQRAGALLGLAPNTQNALAAIDPGLMAAAAEAAVPDGRSLAFDHEGNSMGERTTGAIIGGDDDGQEGLKRKYGCAFMRLGWWEMLCAVRSRLPDGAVRFDRKFAGYEVGNRSVTVRFSSQKDGGGKTAVTAKVLIGADGAFSGVRRQCLDDGKPKSPGTVLWRARVPADAMAGLLANGVVERSWIGGRLLGNAWLVNAATGEGAWVGGTHRTVLEEMGVDFKSEPGARTGMQVLPIGPTAHERATKVLAAFPADYQAMLAATDPDSVVEHGTWARDVAGRWGRGIVSLVGDAAHPVRPVTGQGFGQAAEDAVELAAQLRRHGLGEEALRAFEDARLERCRRVADTEWELGEMAYQMKGASAIKMQEAALKQSQYADFLFSKRFEALVA